MTCEEMTCSRCKKDYWPVDPPEPFVCHRCRAVLAGRNAVDPLEKPNPARLEALKKARAAKRLRKEAPISP